MPGPLVRVASTAVIAAAAAVLTASVASACCYSCGCGTSYVARPVVWEVPVVAVAPAGCCATYGRAYLVERGVGYVAEGDAVEYAPPRAYPYVAPYRPRYGYWAGARYGMHRHYMHHHVMHRPMPYGPRRPMILK